MRDFINKVYILLCFICIVLTITVSICWLFDSKPINLYYIWGISCDSVIVSFLFYLLFGGNKN